MLNWDSSEISTPFASSDGVRGTGEADSGGQCPAGSLPDVGLRHTAVDRIRTGRLASLLHRHVGSSGCYADCTVDRSGIGPLDGPPGQDRPNRQDA